MGLQSDRARRICFFIFYAFVVALVILPADPAVADDPISFGQALSGSIDTVGEIDGYSFDAQAGDRVYALMSTTIDLECYIRLFDPDGNLLNANYDQAGPGTAEMYSYFLPLTGTYTLSAEDYGGDETGDYRVYIQR